MDFSDFLFPGLAAFVMAAFVHLGLTGLIKDEASSAESDMVILAALATFVTTMVARHPEWLT